MKTEFVLGRDGIQNRVECVEKKVLSKVNRKEESVEEKTRKEKQIGENL